VAMSQSWPELRSKLVTYIVGSQGSIKFALGVKLYERSQRVRIIAFAPDCQGDEEIERLEEASDDGYASSRSTGSDEVHCEVCVMDEEIIKADGKVRRGKSALTLNKPSLMANMGKARLISRYTPFSDVK